MSLLTVMRRRWFLARLLLHWVRVRRSFRRHTGRRLSYWTAGEERWFLSRIPMPLRERLSSSWIPLPYATRCENGRTCMRGRWFGNEERRVTWEVLSGRGVTACTCPA